MIKAKKVTYTFTPDEVARILESKFNGSGDEKVSIRFNVSKVPHGYGQGEYDTLELTSVVVTIEEKKVLNG